MKLNKKILKFRKKIRKALKIAETQDPGILGDCKFISNEIHINFFVWHSEKGKEFEVRGWVNDCWGKKRQDVSWRCFYADGFLLDKGTEQDLILRLPGELLKSLANTAHYSKSK